jgi:hypothetical protein
MTGATSSGMFRNTRISIKIPPATSGIIKWTSSVWLNSSRTFDRPFWLFFAKNKQPPKTQGQEPPGHQVQDKTRCPKLTIPTEVCYIFIILNVTRIQNKKPGNCCSHQSTHTGKNPANPLSDKNLDDRSMISRMA